MNDDIDKLKYRNEIEAMSRLRNYKVDDLYNESTNADISNKINELYPSCDGYIYNDHQAVNDVISQPISWDSYFMNIAILASLRSKDTTKVGAVIVQGRKILGVGYNGFPSGVDESKLPTDRVGSLQNVKYAYTVHAELNAILNTVKHDISGSSIYVTLFPCCRCMATLIQKKISEVIYLDDKHHDEPEYIASRKLLELSNIVVRKFEGTLLL